MAEPYKLDPARANRIAPRAQLVTTPDVRENIVLQPLLLTRLAEGRELTIEDYRAEVVTLLATISTTATSGNDSFVVPPEQNFLVTQIRGYLALTAQTSETLAIPGLGNPSVLDRAYIKANNTKLDLQLSDKSLKIFDNRSVVLASILPELGGLPIDFQLAPHPIPGASTLRLDVSVYDTTATIIGGNTDCGVVISGYFVRIRR